MEESEGDDEGDEQGGSVYTRDAEGWGRGGGGGKKQKRARGCSGRKSFGVEPKSKRVLQDSSILRSRRAPNLRRPFPHPLRLARLSLIFSSLYRFISIAQRKPAQKMRASLTHSLLFYRLLLSIWDSRRFTTKKNSPNPSSRKYNIQRKKGRVNLFVFFSAIRSNCILLESS